MTTIVDVRARRVWDSRGRPTVEAEVHTGRGLGRAIAPAGASTGAGEARELRDGGARLGGRDVMQAVAHVQGPIRQALLGRDVADQAGLDAALIALDGTPDKGRLGSNAIVAVSLACAQAAAQAAGLPLWAHMARTGLPCCSFMRKCRAGKAPCAENSSTLTMGLRSATTSTRRMPCCSMTCAT